jgi:hypothetical protein
MSEQKRRIEEKLEKVFEHYRKFPPQKLETDEHGRLLLDPNNPHHRAWYENDDEYEVIDE